MLVYYKEEPHTNIKDLPKQLAKLNVCIDNLYVMSNKLTLKKDYTVLLIQLDRNLEP